MNYLLSVLILIHWNSLLSLSANVPNAYTQPHNIVPFLFNVTMEHKVIHIRNANNRKSYPIHKPRKTSIASLFRSVWKRSSVMKTWFDFLFPSYGYTLIQRRYKYVSSKQHFQLLYSTVHSSGKSVWPKLNIHISYVV